MALINFNAKSVDLGPDDTSDGYDPIPSGKYTAQILESRLVKTSSGNGHYLELTWQIAEGPYQRRLVWDHLNIDNPSANTVEIAKKDLAKICRAFGLEGFSDSSELHGMPCEIRVTTRKGDKGYSDKNEVKGYYALESKTTQAPAVAATQSPPWPTNPPRF